MTAEVAEAGGVSAKAGEIFTALLATSFLLKGGALCGRPGFAGGTGWIASGPAGGLGGLLVGICWGGSIPLGD